jgi:hypothetical protein
LSSSARAPLEASILAWMRAALWNAPDRRESDPTGALLLESFREQVAAMPAYLSYARYVGIDPERITDWRDIPPVPSSAFKSHDLSSAPNIGAQTVTFQTSGTSISRPGRVRLSSTRLYETSLLRNFERHVLPDGARLRALIFGPLRTEAPSSSLWFMVDAIVRAFTLRATYLVRAGEPDWKVADESIAEAQRSGEPLLLLGTTLLFMAYFERLREADRTFALPPGSRAMDTGGSKGLRSEFARSEVEEGFANRLGIPGSHLVNEYGMAEMGSQFYDDALLAAHERRPALRGKRIPPWVRTRVLDPETMQECSEGEAGILVHYDLANLEIPLAIQTEDVGRRVADRLILQGRLLGAEARGCSLAFEEFLDVARGDPGTGTR